MTFCREKPEAKAFEANPALFLESAIKEYVASSALNRLPAFGGEPIFDEPLVGFADGDDPIFAQYKVVAGDFHLTPREALEAYFKDGERPARVSVIAWVLPITRETRVSMRRECLIPSLRWNHTRWQGGDFMVALSRCVVGLLEEHGYQAVASNYEAFFAERELANGPSSNWSQRHIAYAAGLGTFSLNDGFISPRGISVRCGSVVSNIALPPSPRTYENRLANCLFYKNGSCRRCIERCPAGAISERGHDKIKCQEFVKHEQTEILKRMGREEGYMGHYLACGACQTKVPCEDRIPPEVPAKH